MTELKKNYMRRFNLFLESNKGRPFVWGEWDCCVFAADAIEIMTGEDKMGVLRGSYDSKLGAARVLRERGQGTLVKTVKNILGKEIPKSKVAQGDIVIINNNVGVCTGTRAVFLGEDSYITLPISSASHCFSIR